MLWLQKLKKNDLCWEEGDIIGGGCLQLGGGAVCLDAGVGEEEGEIGKGRGGEAAWWYINFYR
jgi:hypothetical protein